MIASSSIMYLLSVIVGILFMIPTLTSPAIVHVSKHGHDSPHCVNGGQAPCNTLSYIINYSITHQRNMSDLAILLESDIKLRSVIELRSIPSVNVTNLSINGSCDHGQIHHSCGVKRIQCLDDGALRFINVRKVTIFNIEMDSCGALLNHTEYRAALLFKNSFNITIMNSTIRKSKFTGIIFLACSGTNLLQSVSLLDNGCVDDKCNHPHSNFTFPAGISIEITDETKEAHYNLTDCIIENNIGNQFNNSIDKTLPNSKIYWNGHGIGGGIGVYFNKNCSGNSFSVLRTNVSYNYGKWGGGMYVQFENTTHNNFVLVEKSRFCHNNASSAGGGVNMVFITEQTEHTNQVTFRQVELVGNRARRYGGGLGITSMYGNTEYKPGVNVAFYSCTLRDNTADYSAAVDVSPYYFEHRVRTGFLPIPLFSNVEISGNFIPMGETKLKKNIRITTGVFSITQFTVHFAGRVNFTNNHFSALHLSSAVAAFENGTNCLFRSNSGSEYNGGAIAMYGFSTILVSVNTHFEFLENKAGQGGAIYYETSDQLTFITGTACFIQFNGSRNMTIEDRNITFYFKGNMASKGGASSIYADSFYSCLYVCPKQRYSITKDIMKCIGNVTLDDNDNNLQSSSKSFDFEANFMGEVSMIPGATMKIPFTVKDEFNQTISPLMSLSVSANSHPFQVSEVYTLGKEISPRGRPGNRATLRFITQGIGGIFFLFNVTLLNCPPGFYFKKELLSCVCSVGPDKRKNNYNAVMSCDMDTYQATIKRDYWAGYITNTNYTYKHLYFAPCFKPLCNSLTLLPNSSAELEFNVCAKNRTGIMCGRCVEGYSVYYHSRDFFCKANHLCKWGPVLYLVSEILPVCVLFVVIVIFDFSFTSGGTVGFIFFCQYLDRLVIHIDEKISYTRKAYRLFYGIFNFDFFSLNPLSFCLWKDLQVLDVISFRYLTIFTAFVLVVALLSLLKNNRCTWLLKWRIKITTKRSFVRGLSAFLVICYSQSTKTSFLILKSTNPIGFNGMTFQRYSYYGGLLFLRDHHLIYAIPAIISLVFVTILPPLLLLVHPATLHLLSLCNLNEHWVVNRILKLMAMNKLMPFLDCFQSCYKDKLRFFAGLYFVYRVVILCTFTLFETYYEYRLSSELALILFLGIHAIVQPYKKQLHNLIDSLVFLNLALINGCSIYSDYLLEEAEDTEYEKNAPLMLLTTIQMLLLYLPMLVSLIYAGFKIYLLCRKITGRRDYEMLN